MNKDPETPKTPYFWYVSLPPLLPFVVDLFVSFSITVPCECLPAIRTCIRPLPGMTPNATNLVKIPREALAADVASVLGLDQLLWRKLEQLYQITLIRVVVSLVLLEFLVRGETKVGRGTVLVFTHPRPAVLVAVVVSLFRTTKSVVEVDAGDVRAFEACRAVVPNECFFLRAVP